MATQQLQLVCDSSTLANYIAWAKPISDWFRSIGYTNTADTGQLNGAGGGVGGAAGWAALAGVPGSAAYFYEIFQTNDGLTRFFVKAEYGNVSGTNCPSLRFTLSTSMNGSGTPTGFIVGPINTNLSVFTAPSTTTQFECNFSGDSANSRIAIMMWRNGTNLSPQVFAIQRALNASGVAQGTYVTLFTCGSAGGGGATGSNASQQTLHFVNGAGPRSSSSASFPQGGSGGFLVRCPGLVNASVAFAGSIPLDMAAPSIGFYDYECTVIGVGNGADFVEGVTFTITLYGATKTYMPTKTAVTSACMGAGFGPTFALCMEYD